MDDIIIEKDGVSTIKKKLITIGIIVGVLLVLATLADGLFNNFSFFKWMFAPQETKIDKTENVISEVRKIAEYTTACFYEQTIIQKEKTIPKERHVDKNLIHRFTRTGNTVLDSIRVANIVMILSTKVRAGFDLSKIGEADMSVKGDTISICLPPVEIFDIIANPSDWEIYDRKGKWEDQEIRDIQAGVKEEIKKDAIEYGLLEKAESFGKESLISLFKTFGFKEVVLK